MLRIRNELCLTQKEMEGLTGYASTKISRVENDEVVPKDLEEMIDAYARVVHKTPEEARREIIRLMFPESEQAQGAQALADEAQKPSKRRQAK